MCGIRIECFGTAAVVLLEVEVSMVVSFSTACCSGESFLILHLWLRGFFTSEELSFEFSVDGTPSFD